MTIIHAWIGLSLFGLFLSTYLARESWLDMKAFGMQFRRAWPPVTFTNLEGNGSVRHAVSRFIREFLRMTVHAAYLGIGIPVWDRPLEPNLTVLGLMWGNFVLVVNSFIDARTIRQTMPRWRASHHIETQDQREDREFGEQRRELETIHKEDEAAKQ